MNVAGNLFLIGLMGAGKTSVGRVLSRKWGKSFHDSDHEIEARTGVRIPLIFELEGESGFRNREVEVIAELTRMKDIILATGGGAVLRTENRAALRGNGIVIYLRANVDDLWERTRHDRNRPLLQTENPRDRLQQLYDERDPIYRELADVIVDTTRQNIQYLIGQLERKVQRYLTERRPQHHDHT